VDRALGNSEASSGTPPRRANLDRLKFPGLDPLVDRGFRDTEKTGDLCDLQVSIQKSCLVCHALIISNVSPLSIHLNVRAWNSPFNVSLRFSRNFHC
jgi:hypothetical protein